MKEENWKNRALQMQVEKPHKESNVGVWTADTPMEIKLSKRARVLEDENEKLKLDLKRAGESRAPWGR